MFSPEVLILLFYSFFISVEFRNFSCSRERNLLYLTIWLTVGFVGADKAY